MDTNLNKIAKDLYGKIETRFPDIKIGDENAEVLSRKADIPRARFFEFEYEHDGVKLGNVAITLDSDDGVVVQISGSLAEKKHPGVFKFIRGLRSFAKDRLLNFDIQNINKDQLDKRDYEFQSKPKEEFTMMESKMYGTAKISYQDLGEARLVIKHSQPVNLDLAAGRTMHIEGIYVENAQGERFKYPYKHLNGARALAEHIKAGGNPYDNIGKHITSLSEELAQLRKFKSYVSRNETLSEAMGGITDVVFNRIDSIKKEIHNLQRPSYYQAFAESFETREEQMIPEEIMSDFIDRLTIRTFNEELKTAFPFIFRLIDESDIPVRELTADDLLDEAGNPAQAAIAISKKESGKYNKEGKRIKESPEDQFESFMNQLVAEDETDQQGVNTLFSSIPEVRAQAVKNLKDKISQGLKPGTDGVNAALTLKGIIDSDKFTENYLKGMSDNDNIVTVLKQFIKDVANNDPKAATSGKNPGAQDAAKELLASGELDNMSAEVTPDIGSEAPPEAPPAQEPSAETPPPSPEAPPAPGGEVPPELGAGAPPAPEAPPAPVAESAGRNLAKIKAKIIKARECGADLSTKMDFGHRAMTLHDAIKECGMTPMECGFEESEFTHNIGMAHKPSKSHGEQEIESSISGFWNPDAHMTEGNFTIGATRVISKILKSYKNGEYQHATPHDVKKVISKVKQMDPQSSVKGVTHKPNAHPADMPSSVAEELSRIRKLSGV